MVPTDPRTSTSDHATVLAVDDDPDVRTTYEIWLDDDWEIRTAADGETALRELDASVDVVVLDRMMPGLSGQEVLAEIRDRDADPRVVMVTAVDPETDIVEIPFDAYLPKPIDREALNETVETLLDRRDYHDKLQEYYALVEKRATLKAETPDNVLEDDEAFQRLTQRIEELESELTAEMVNLDSEEFVALLDDVV